MSEQNVMMDSEDQEFIQREVADYERWLKEQQRLPELEKEVADLKAQVAELQNMLGGW